MRDLNNIDTDRLDDTAKLITGRMAKGVEKDKVGTPENGIYLAGQSISQISGYIRILTDEIRALKHRIAALESPGE
jgi:hypothetical protein